MASSLTSIARLLDSFDLWNGFLLAVTLHIVGACCSQSRTELQQIARRIGFSVFLILLLANLIHDGSLHSLISRIFQAGVLTWIAAGSAKILIPVVATLADGWSRSHSQSLAGKRSAKQKRLQIRQAKLQEEQRRRRDEDWEAGREEREQAAEEARQQKQAELDRSREEQKRREVARFEVRLLFDRHAGDIRTSIPRRRFDEYIESDLSDKYPAETVEQRAQQMKQTILDFFESSEPETKNTPEAIDSHYEAELERISQLGLDDESTAAMRSELAFAWHRSKQSGKIVL
ncbi:MAG: hypothetical protein ABJZ55_10980 [Fuerstiella sp.]